MGQLLEGGMQSVVKIQGFLSGLLLRVFSEHVHVCEWRIPKIFWFPTLPGFVDNDNGDISWNWRPQSAKAACRGAYIKCSAYSLKALQILPCTTDK